MFLNREPLNGEPLNRKLDRASLREAFGHVPSGVAAICTLTDGAPQGIVASTFTVGVSLDPPLVMFAVQNSSRTWPLVKAGQQIGVSILAATQRDVCRQIASKSAERFAGVEITATGQGAVFLNDAGLWLDCSVESEVPAGDHSVVLLRVHGTSVRDNSGDPLVFHGSEFRSLEQPSYV